MPDDANRESRARTRAPAYENLWPIALAPLVPAVGLACRASKDPAIRLGVPGAVALGILVFAHGFALSVSSDSK